MISLRSASLAIAVVSVAALARPARAHFELVAPQNWANQDGTGSPQKSAPCGQADPGSPAVATNAVTGFMVGATVTITIDEKIFHPGHYRVALAADMASLPADPAVHAGGGTPCGTADIMANPVLPILADNQLVHTSSFSGPQTFQVTLPAGMACTHCTLQVLEFMSNHPAPCFYHHCANISINATGADAGPIPADAPGGSNGGGGGTNPSGCSSGGANGLAAALAVVGMLGLRRRRRA